jgi:pimeloyl-ACP methyl ester carboxylesterase
MPLGKAARFFRRRGRRVWIVPHSFRSMRDVRRRAEVVANTIRDVLRLTGSAELDILAYSMGGPAALYALQRFDLAGKIRVFVSYGAPYQGTTSSLVILLTGYFANMADQLLPGSDILTEVAAAGLPAGPRYVSVAGTKDWLCPQERARLPGAEHALCDHLDFLVNSRVYAFLEPYLR